jgi:hypothetical protein
MRGPPLSAVGGVCAERLAGRADETESGRRGTVKYVEKIGGREDESCEGLLRRPPGCGPRPLTLVALPRLRLTGLSIGSILGHRQLLRKGINSHICRFLALLAQLIPIHPLVDARLSQRT